MSLRKFLLLLIFIGLGFIVGAKKAQVQAVTKYSYEYDPELGCRWICSSHGYSCYEREGFLNCLCWNKYVDPNLICTCPNPAASCTGGTCTACCTPGMIDACAFWGKSCSPTTGGGSCYCPSTKCILGLYCVPAWCNRLLCINRCSEDSCTGGTCNPYCDSDRCPSGCESEDSSGGECTCEEGDKKCEPGGEYYECEYIAGFDSLKWVYKYDCLDGECLNDEVCAMEEAYCETIGCCSDEIKTLRMCWEDQTKEVVLVNNPYCEDTTSCEYEGPKQCTKQVSDGKVCLPKNASNYEACPEGYYCQEPGEPYCCPGSSEGECVPTEFVCVGPEQLDCVAAGYPDMPYACWSNCGTYRCTASATFCDCVPGCDPPGAPSLDPGEGDTVQLGVGEQVMLSWSKPVNADTFEMELCPEGINCTVEYTGSSTTYEFDPTTSDYLYRVQGFNADCPETGGAWAEANFDIRGRIEGTVREGDGEMVGGVCTGAGEGFKPGGESVVSASGGGSGGAVNDFGTYSISNLAIGTGGVVSLIIGDLSTWQCNCPDKDSCAYGDISAPVEDLDFFVSNERAAWFQVEDGSLHANAGNVSSSIPASATEPYLITGSAGVVSYTGSLGLGDLDEESINETGESWRAVTSYGGIVTDYGYFARLLQDDPAGVGSWDGIGKPGSGVYQAEGVSQIKGGFNVDSGEKIIVLVDDDVTIEDNIMVSKGGFLSVISKGDINIDGEVEAIEGVYVADGIINTGSSSKQLEAEGIFVGWTGMSLGRDLEGSLDNTTPAEKFVWRPDLELNAHQYLSKPYYSWVEVAP